MKSLVVFGTLFALPLVCLAQIADPHVLASSGSEGVNTDLKMEWTMGQLGIGQGGNNHYHLTQGFHQPAAPQVTVGVPELERLTQAMKLWPNPANESINFQLNTPVAQQLDIAVYDERGATVQSRNLPSMCRTGMLNTTGLASGNYIVLVRSAGGAVYGMARFIKVD